MTTFLKLGGLVGFALVGMGGAAVMPPENSDQTSKVPQLYAATANCTIKGNISIRTDEKIYHVQGQEYYTATKIRPYYGERWFCTEADARAAGWRRARN